MVVALLTGVTGALPAQAVNGTGRIEGSARIAARLTSPRQRVRVYAEPGSPQTPPPADEHLFVNVMLHLESVNALRAEGRTGTAPLRMIQRGERFVPHVLPMLTGTIVDFPNEDPVYHNVFSLSRARTFDLGRFTRGESRQVRFTAPGVVQIFCHIHADMSAYIMVFDHPFFVMPDAQGRFVLDNVPPGDYQLVGWHERVRPVRIPVRVEAGRTTQVSVDIPVTDAPRTP